MKFTDIFIRRPVLSVVISLLIVVLGMRSLFNLPINQFPRTQNAVVTVTTAFSVWGYWLIGRLPTDRRPSTRISRLMTTARTGRRMNRSVNFMAGRSAFLRRRVLIV